VKARYFVHICYLVFYLKRRFYLLKMKPFVFFMSISSIPLDSQNDFYYIIWTSKNTPKVSSTIMLLFKRLGIILVMKTNSINHIRMFITSILKSWKKTKYLQKNVTYFQIFQLYFQIVINFRSNSSTCKYFFKTWL